MDNKHLDRQRVDHEAGQQSTFTFLAPAAGLPPLEKVTSVGVVPFDENGCIVAAKLDRGVDIPGGHMHVGERTFTATARRECMEEAFITLGELDIACVIQSDYYGSAPDQLTYMIIMTGPVATFEAVVPNEESQGRVVLPVADFLAQYTAADKSFIGEIINRAQAVYRQQAES